MVITTTMIISIISVTLAAAGMFAGFMYKNGQMRTEIENVKEQQMIIKQDLKEEIDKVSEVKADKAILDMVLSLFKELSIDIKDVKSILMKHVKEG